MLEQVLSLNCQLIPDMPLVVGVSGGPDSLCLMHILHVAGYPVIVACFNHLLRPEAEQEIQSVASLAGSLGLTFISDQADVKGYASENNLTLEEAARIQRYRFLFAVAEKRGAQAVAVGHTSDDQVETVLMHFLRGAGLSGLKGMEYRSILPIFHPAIPLVRPLLSLWRRDTEQYCQEHGLHAHLDASNSDQAYFRNRLRHTLIPELEKYNPQFKQALLHTSTVLQGDAAIISEVLEKDWQQVLKEKGTDWVAFDKSLLGKLTPSRQRIIFRKAAQFLRPQSRDFGFDAIERALHFLQNPRGESVDISNGLCVFLEGEILYLAAYEADLPHGHWPASDQAQDLKIGALLELGKGWILTSELLAHGAGRKDLPPDNWQAWLDADLVEKKLIIRPRQAGDTFLPLGMAGHKVKLQDYFINVKIPRRARTNWPLVCAGEEIAWIPGYGIAHSLRVTEGTKSILALSLKKNRSGL